MIFNTKISGIPCQCKVTTYRPYQFELVESENLTAPEPAEFHFVLLDRKGYRAEWLEKKMKENDEDRLYEEFQTEHIGERFGYIE